LLWNSETTSDEGGHVKVGAATALASISYDFGLSIVMRTRIGSLESYSRYFLKGYGRLPSAESVPDPQTNKAMVFEDFFTAGLLMLPHPILLDILHKFQVQLHQLTPNAIVQIGKFIWAIISCRGHPSTDVFTHHYELH
jgi:hypothetical protein